MARTLKARLPRQFRTRFEAPRKKSHSCIFWIIYNDFYTENGIFMVPLEPP